MATQNESIQVIGVFTNQMAMAANSSNAGAGYNDASKLGVVIGIGQFAQSAIEACATESVLKYTPLDINGAFCSRDIRHTQQHSVRP